MPVRTGYSAVRAGRYWRLMPGVHDADRPLFTKTQLQQLVASNQDIRTTTGVRMSLTTKISDNHLPLAIAKKEDAVRPRSDGIPKASLRKTVGFNPSNVRG